MKISKLGWLFLVVMVAACDKASEEVQQSKTETYNFNEYATEGSGYSGFAIIGDYGTDDSNEASVVSLVKNTFTAMSSDLYVVTVGDNNYTLGAAGDSETNLEVLYSAYNSSVCESQNGNGEFYKSFLPNGQCPDPATMPVPPARGSACTAYDGSALDIQQIDFYPIPGNEDYHAPGISEYAGNLDAYNGYFRWARQGCAMNSCNSNTEQWIQNKYGVSFQCEQVPQNSYDVVRDDNHLFFLDTSWLLNSSCNPLTNNGFSPAVCYNENNFEALSDDFKGLCAQGFWLEWAANQTDSDMIKMAFMHHSPFSSSNHGSCGAVQYNFRSFGVDSVFSGHSHVYERVTTNNDQGDDAYIYFINGIGGAALNNVCENNYSVGEPYFSEEGGEQLSVQDVTGYNGNKHGFGAMFVLTAPPVSDEIPGKITTFFYDARYTAVDDYLDVCGINPRMQQESSPVFESCIISESAADDFQSCDVDSF